MCDEEESFLQKVIFPEIKFATNETGIVKPNEAIFKGLGNETMNDIFINLDEKKEYQLREDEYAYKIKAEELEGFNLIYSVNPNNINMHVARNGDKFIIDFIDGFGSDVTLAINNIAVTVPSEMIVTFEDNGKIIVIDYQ